MHLVAQQDLPFRGMSHAFVGADQGGSTISAYLVDAPVGRGSRRHRHPYDEVSFVRAGRGRWTVGGEEREAGPGDVLVIKAGEVHAFSNIGDAPLVFLSVHVSERFVQEDLD
jgi:quercetin dioxygenase-like cupin family protein